MPSRVLPLVYNDLRRMAHRYIGRERRNHTLDATGLVHEASLRLLAQEGVECHDRAHLLAFVAHVMRQVLVEYARSQRAYKRGGPDRQRVDWQECLVTASETKVDVLDLDRAMDRLAELDPQQAQIVEMRFFAGTTVEETAQALEISTKTELRRWVVAQAWLHAQLAKGRTADGSRTLAQAE